MSIGSWPKKKGDVPKEPIHVCKVHGGLLYEGQVSHNGRGYYQCRACASANRKIGRVYVDYMCKTK